MSYNYKTRPHALYMHKDGIKSRVTTLIHRPLTRSASPSIWQYFCNITVAPGTAYWSSKLFFHISWLKISLKIYFSVRFW